MANFLACDESLRVGISRDFNPLRIPINGLRLPPEGNMTGWYIWSTETFSEANDFFNALCASHLHEVYPEILKYLDLAPGWRFLIAPGYEDAWFDENLLNV